MLSPSQVRVFLGKHGLNIDYTWFTPARRQSNTLVYIVAMEMMILTLQEPEVFEHLMDRYYRKEYLKKVFKNETGNIQMAAPRYLINALSI